VDVWAAAASLYKLITGEYPRDFPEDQDPWRVVLNKAPVPILRRGRFVGPHLALAMDEALVDNPGIRHQSALSLKTSLIKAAHQDGLIMEMEEP
jgi:hypothetical protein